MEYIHFILELVEAMFDFVKSNFGTFWMILALYFAYKNMSGISDALKGNNGRWQTDEVAVFVLLCITVYVFIKDGSRSHEWRHFSDLEVILLLFTIITIAGLKDALTAFINFTRGKKEEPEEPEKSEEELFPGRPGDEEV